MNNLDLSKEKSISNLINSYINPINPICKITYLKTHVHMNPIYDKDGDTGDEEPIIIQNIFCEYFQIIPDSDNHFSEYNLLKFYSIDKKKYIPTSVFLKWKKDKLLKNKCKSFYFINSCDFFKNDFYISNHKNNNIKNILKNINLIGYPNSIYKIKYQIKTEYITLQENEFILETDRSEVIFKSNIKDNNKNKSWKNRFLIIKNLENSGKIIENNPVDYIYSCIEKGKISLEFILLWIDKITLSYYSESNKAKNLILLNHELLL